MSRWGDAAHTAADVGKGLGVAVGVGAVVAGSAMPDLTATDYYADRPVQGIVAAAADITEGVAETSKGQDEMTADLDGVPEAESAEHAPAPEGSTFAAADDAEAVADDAGEGDAFAAESTDGTDALGDADGDAFAAGDTDTAADGLDSGDQGDADGDTGGDSDADADGDSDGGSEGGGGGW